MSIFNMKQVNHIATTDFPDAVQFVKAVIDADETARPETKEKAHRMLAKARNSQNLAIAMSNWILAHPGEGLKTIY